MLRESDPSLSVCMLQPGFRTISRFTSDPEAAVPLGDDKRLHGPIRPCGAPPASYHHAAEFPRRKPGPPLGFVSWSAELVGHDTILRARSNFLRPILHSERSSI